MRLDRGNEEEEEGNQEGSGYDNVHGDIEGVRVKKSGRTTSRIRRIGPTSTQRKGMRFLYPTYLTQKCWDLEKNRGSAASPIDI